MPEDKKDAVKTANKPAPADAKAGGKESNSAAAKPATEKKAEKPVSTDAKADKKVEVPAKFKDLVATIEKMSVLELSELVKVLEDKFGVSAAVAAAPSAAPAGGGESEEEEKSEYNIEIKDVGGQKIQVIKAVREITGKGLKDAKDFVDKAPCVIKEKVAKKDAEEAKKKLEAAGAKVELK